MISNDDRSPAVETAEVKNVSPSARRPRSRWPRVALTMVLLLTGFYVARKYIPFRIDDGFIAFEPDASVFPAAPVDDATTMLGIGQPIGWPVDQIYCPYDTVTSYDTSAFANDWHTIRHDWTQDGSARAWVISERTVGFRSLREFDRVVQSFRDRTKYCGWTFTDGFPGYNSIWTELDGLPDDAFAFTIDANPQGHRLAGSPDSDWADFHALGAYMPGHKRGQVMYVMWIGWGTDVPRDQFVAAANTLFDAAHRSPRKKDDDSGDDKHIDYEFTDFDPEAAGVLDVVGEDARQTNSSGSLAPYRCNRWFGNSQLWDSSSSRWPGPERGLETDTRVVGFGASRWPERSDYLRARDQSFEAVQTRCIDSYQPPGMLIEPTDIPGLPEGTLAAKWTDDADAYALVIADDDKQILMIVIWRERRGPIPEDKLVEVVNRAWNKFQADNP